MAKLGKTLWITFSFWFLISIDSGNCHNVTEAQIEEVRMPAIINGPQDTTAERTNTIILRCETNYVEGATIWWTMVGENSKTIYQYSGRSTYYQPRSKYDVREIDEQRGDFDLYVKDVVWQDGGTYECRLVYSFVGFDDSVIADVVILERPLITQTPQYAVEGDYVAVVCSLSFGTPYKNLTEDDSMWPHVEVYYKGVQLTGGVYTEIMNLPNVLYSSIYEQHNMSLTWEDDGQRVDCDGTVDEPYRSVTMMTSLNVQFGARSISFEPEKDQYFVGEIITAKVLANPDTDIIWEPLHDSNLEDIEGDQLRLDSSLLGNNRWKVTANNTVDYIIYFVDAEHEFLVVPQTTTTTTQSTPTEEGGSGASAIFANTIVLFTSFVITLNIRKLLMPSHS